MSKYAGRRKRRAARWASWTRDSLYQRKNGARISLHTARYATHKQTQQGSARSHTITSGLAQHEQAPASPRGKPQALPQRRRRRRKTNKAAPPPYTPPPPGQPVSQRHEITPLPSPERRDQRQARAGRQASALQRRPASQAAAAVAARARSRRRRPGHGAVSGGPGGMRLAASAE